MQEIYPLPPTTTLFSQIVRWKLVLDMVVTVFDYQCSRIMDPWSQNKVHKVRRWDCSLQKLTSLAWLNCRIPGPLNTVCNIKNCSRRPAVVRFSHQLRDCGSAGPWEHYYTTLVYLVLQERYSCSYMYLTSTAGVRDCGSTTAVVYALVESRSRSRKSLVLAPWRTFFLTFIFNSELNEF